MKKSYVIGGWLAIIGLLLILANTLPTVENKIENSNSTYAHSEDNYTVALTGLWQVYDEGKKSLTLINLENDCTITFALEVGGYDYLTPIKSAENLIKETKTKFTDFKVIEEPRQGTIAGYSAAAYLCQFNSGKDAYYGEESIIHPNEGIRLYASIIYPAHCDGAVIKEAENIVNSIIFMDTEALYSKYM